MQVEKQHVKRLPFRRKRDFCIGGSVFSKGAGNIQPAGKIYSRWKTCDYNGEIRSVRKLY